MYLIKDEHHTAPNSLDSLLMLLLMASVLTRHGCQGCQLCQAPIHHDAEGMLIMCLAEAQRQQ